MHKNQTIGVDWGSSGFRAYRFDAHTNLLDTASFPRGIKKVKSEQFEATLFELIGDWLIPGSKALLSGMITSRNGWVETPYLATPAKLSDLMAHAESRVYRDVEMQFLPGLCQSSPRADVIRGEELQLFGAANHMDNAIVVMPGTHSKWATLNNGCVQKFQTIITGELFDVLLNNTLVGQLCSGQQFFPDQFADGVKRGFSSSMIVSELFQCRSGVLLDQLRAEHVHSYLSGLLIGNEFKEGLSFTQVLRNEAVSHAPELVLIGSDTLCERYDMACNLLNMKCIRSDANIISDAFAALISSG